MPRIELVTPWRFIDDDMLIHGVRIIHHIPNILTSISLLHLPFELPQHGVATGIKIVDLHIPNICEPRYCTHFKKTHCATYIPWASNTPRPTKIG